MFAQKAKLSPFAYLGLPFPAASIQKKHSTLSIVLVGAQGRGLDAVDSAPVALKGTLGQESAVQCSRSRLGRR
jgi:hypothetical protein